MSDLHALSVQSHNKSYAELLTYSGAQLTDLMDFSTKINVYSKSDNYVLQKDMTGRCSVLQGNYLVKFRVSSGLPVKVKTANVNAFQFQNAANVPAANAKNNNMLGNTVAVGANSGEWIQAIAPDNALYLIVSTTNPNYADVYAGMLAVPSSVLLYEGKLVDINGYRVSASDPYVYADMGAVIPKGSILAAYVDNDADASAFSLNVRNSVTGAYESLGNVVKNEVRIFTAPCSFTMFRCWADDAKRCHVKIEFRSFSDVLNDIDDLSESEKGNLIFTDGLYPEISGNKLIITSKTYGDGYAGTIYYNRKNDRKTIRFEDVVRQVGAENAVIDSQAHTLTITMPSVSYLAYDVEKDEFVLDYNRTDTSTDGYNYPAKKHLNILLTRYYSQINGKLTWWIGYRKAMQAQSLFAKMSFNSALHTGASDFDVACTRYANLFYGDTIIPGHTAPVNTEAFLFFTDPHWFGPDSPKMEECIAQIQKYYNSTPTNFVLCGGDWLWYGTTPSEAVFRLGYISGICRSMLKPCYILFGNHDDNYQGRAIPGGDRFTTRLSIDSTNGLLYGGGKAYYKFDGNHTRFYCLDNRGENDTLDDLGGYLIDQAKWFAKSLQSETMRHIAICMHMFYSSYAAKSIHSLSDLALSIAYAYNTRGSITVGGQDYSYASATGRIEFAICGHTHADFNIVHNGVPVICTTTAAGNKAASGSSYSSDYPTFDLVQVDYDKRKINLVRVGDGADRSINL